MFKQVLVVDDQDQKEQSIAKPVVPLVLLCGRAILRNSSFLEVGFNLNLSPLSQFSQHHAGRY
jgi:hypothetical protein